MSIQIVKGSSKNLIVRLKNAATGDPLDLTGATLIKACFEGDAGSVNVFRLVLTGNTTSGDPHVLGINTANIQVGDPITGAGIPAGTTVLDTSTNNLSLAANSILLSQAATATASAVSLIVGSVQVASAIIGKINIGLTPAQSDLLSSGGTQDFEVTVIDSLGFKSIVQFAGTLNVVERFC